jgi:peptidyl-prolyl cis-trans isomerase SurA
MMRKLPSTRTVFTPSLPVAARLKLPVVLLCLSSMLSLPAAAQFKAGLRPEAGTASNPTPVPAATAAAAGVRPVDAIAAVVNNDVITRNDLAQRVRIVERRMRSQKIAVPPQDQLEKQLLERMISDRAQVQMANEMGIKIDDTLLDRAVARIAEQNKLSVTDFRNEIERDGTPFPLFREEIREEITIQRLREQEVDKKIQITDSEVDAYLNSATGAQAQEEINLAQILVRIPENASAEQIAARMTRAEDVLRQLKTGADFGKTAATFSDAGDALEGGNLGWRNADRLPQLFVDATAGLKQGETSKIVKSANGYHILRVLGRRSVADAKTAGAANAVQQTHARHILIKVNQVVTAAEAKRKLTDLKERLDNKSAKFEDLAKLFSNDLSASKGGDLGWIYPGDTVPDFERAMDGLKPGEVSAPVETPFGYHLIEVLERKADDVSRERQRLMARQAIRERKLDEATQDWVRQVRDRAYVEIRSDDRS